MLNTKSKRLSTVMLLVVAFLCSVFAFTSLGFTRTASAEDDPLPTPIAKYLFTDAKNIGKDSVGNYDMSIVGGNDQFTQVDNGVEFAGGFALAMTGNNLFEGLTEFTMSFEMKLNGGVWWGNVIGIAYNSGNYFYFDNTLGSAVRFHAKGQNGDCWNGANIEEPAAGYTRITVSAKAGGYLKLYINGVEYQNTNYSAEEKGKINKQFGDDWTLYNEGEDGYVFSIGAPANKKGDVGTLDFGGIKELVFYNTQFTDAQVTQYWTEYANSHAKVSSVNVDFTQTLAVSADASESFIMSNIAKKGEFAATMSNDETKTVSVEWKKVVTKNGKRYIEGDVTGANNPDNVKAYASFTEYEGTLTKADLDLTSQIVLPADLETSEILKYVPASGTYMVEVGENSVPAKITWNDVTNDKNGDGSDTTTYIVGTVTEVTNTNDVKAYAKIYTSDTVFDPLAKYEFKDPTNPGKDSMGQYDLVANGGMTVANGVASFDGVDDYLTIVHDFTDEISSFSLSFEINMPTANTQWWAAPVFFGLDGKKWLSFNFSAQDAPWNTMLRFSMSDRADGTKGNITGNDNECWGHEIGYVSATGYDKVTLTVQAGGKCKVYFNGTLKFTGDVPADFSMQSNKLKFELGKAYSGDGINLYFEGNLKNVTVYDFALTESQVKVFEAYDKALALANDKYITSFDATTITFDNDAQATEVLTDEMTLQDMKDKLNAAKVTTTLNDGTKGELSVYWENVTLKNGDYYANGYIRTAGLATPYVLESRAVEYKLDVKKTIYVQAAENLTGGTVEVDKEEAFAGTTVTITVTPARGYELSAVTVNGTALTADGGEYKYTLQETDTNVEVSATFVRVYAITVDDVDNATVQLSRPTAHAGDEITVTINVVDGYKLTSVKVNGEELQAVEGVYKFTVTADTTVTVEVTKEKSGCGSAIDVSSMGMLFVIFAACGMVLFARKRKAN